MKQQEQVQLGLSDAELQQQIKEAAVETLEERVAAAKNAQPGANIDELERSGTQVSMAATKSPLVTL